MAASIFNLFTEGLHWIRASRSTAAIIHYLDLSLAIFCGSNEAVALECEQIFTNICQELSLEIEVTSNALSTVIELLGLITDTTRIEARLPGGKRAVS
jgi:hypothetical protein